MTTELSKIDLNLLVLFEVVCSTGAIGAAAERLHMTQPAMSMGLKRLRELVDDPLFVRAGRGVEPTVKASQLIGPVREALGIINRQLAGGEAFDLAGLKRHFRIVVADSMEPVVMPPILRRIAVEAPEITIESVAGTREFGAELKSGQLDMACFGYLIDGADIKSVAVDLYDLVAIVRRDHPRARRGLDIEGYRKLRHVVLNRELQIVANVVKDMVAADVTRRVPYVVGKLWSVPAIVEATDMAAMLPRRFATYAAARFDIEIHEAPMPLPRQHVYLMWHERHEDDPGHRWLREAIVEVARAPMPEIAPRAAATTAVGRSARGKARSGAGGT